MDVATVNFILYLDSQFNEDVTRRRMLTSICTTSHSMTRTLTCPNFLLELGMR